MTITEVPFCHSFLRHYIEERGSYHFKENDPMIATTYSAPAIYEIKDPNELLRDDTAVKKRERERERRGVRDIVPVHRRLPGGRPSTCAS